MRTRSRIVAPLRPRRGCSPPPAAPPAPPARGGSSRRRPRAARRPAPVRCAPGGRRPAGRPRGRQAPAERRQRRPRWSTRTTAQANPALLPALDAVSAKLTTDDLIKLNAAVDVERKSADGRRLGVGAATTSVTDGLQKGSGKVVVGAPGFTESQILANDLRRRAQGRRASTPRSSDGRQPRPLPAGARGPEHPGLPRVPRHRHRGAQQAGQRAERRRRSPAATSRRRCTALPSRWPSKVGPDLRDAVGGGRPERLRRHHRRSPTSSRSRRSPSSPRPAADGSLVLGGPTECPTRPFCQPGLEKTYGLKFACFKRLDAGGPLTKAAISRATSRSGWSSAPTAPSPSSRRTSTVPQVPAAGGQLLPGGDRAR